MAGTVDATQPKTLPGFGRGRPIRMSPVPAIIGWSPGGLNGEQRRHRVDALCDRAGAPDDDAGPRALLRGPGARQERAFGVDAVLYDHGSRFRAVDDLWLQPGLRYEWNVGGRGQSALLRRWSRQVLHGWRPGGVAGRDDSRVRVRHIPAHFR